MSEIAEENVNDVAVDALPESKKADKAKVDTPKADKPKAESAKVPKAKAGFVMMVHKTRKNGDNKLYRQCLPSSVKAFEASGFVVSD
jgi:hypothetical protein